VRLRSDKSAAEDHVRAILHQGQQQVRIVRLKTLNLRPIVEDDIVLNWNAEDPPAVLIAVVDYENPIIVDKLLRLQAQAVVGLPLRTFGILANVLLSVNNHKREKRLRTRLERMNTKLKAHRDIDKAKSILMVANNMTEQTAYQTLREQAMNKRTTIEAIATAIINTSDLLLGRGAIVETATD